MKQDQILTEVLDLYREIEDAQERINNLVLFNREQIRLNPNFEDDYTDSIESYYTT